MSTATTETVPFPQSAGPSSSERSFSRGRNWPALLYAGVVLLTCCWILSLPMFPSQDEPLHLYYVNVFKQLLLRQHTPYTAVYQIRHFLPPYAAYYYGLIGLSSVFSLETADKIFAAINVAFFAVAAYGLVRVLCPRARWAPFLFLPILLSWPTFMGFANFMLSVNLSLVAIACWCIGSRRSGLRYNFIFLGLIAAMILTHPLPWAFAISFAGLELLVRYAQQRDRSDALFRKAVRWDILTIALACISYLYLLPFQTKTQLITRTVFDRQQHVWKTIAPEITGRERMYWQAHSLLHSHGIILFLHSRPSHLYRIGIAFLYAGSFLLASWGAVKRRKALRHADIFVVYSVLLAIGLVVIPDIGVGGYFISTRMQLLAYVCTIAAAAPTLERRATLAPVAAVLCVALSGLTLYLAIEDISPVAKNIAALRTAPAPPDDAALHRPGFLMRPVAADMPYHLGFDPYLWAPIHYYRWRGVVLFNTPWLGEKLIPVQPRPDKLAELDQTYFNQAPEFGDRMLLNDAIARQTLDKVSMVLLQKEALDPPENPFAEIGGSPAAGAFSAGWSCSDISDHRWTMCQRSPTP